jgi:hypothetical protein
VLRKPNGISHARAERVDATPSEDAGIDGDRVREDERERAVGGGQERERGGKVGREGRERLGEPRLVAAEVV